MTRQTFYLMGMVLVALGLILGMAGPAAAGGDDPLLTKPMVLIILDTSGSMDWGKEEDGRPGYDPFDPFMCGINKDLPCNRMQVLQEALTGTYPAGDIYCNDDSKPSKTQLTNGILDTYKDTVRFGLASFDASYSDWYYGDPSFRYGIKPRSGDNCGDECLVDFLDPNNPSYTREHNEKVEARICNYDAGGGTPLGAALYDADWYLKKWQEEIDYDDPFWDCRPKFVILFTDGEESEKYKGKGDVVENAKLVFDNNVPNVLPKVHWPTKTTGVPVFIVGMGDRDNPDDYPGINMAVLDAASSNGTDKAFPQAFMADNSSDLRDQFDAILSLILAGSASRTNLSSQPSMAFNSNFQYKAYFDVTEAGPWQGHLVREEITDANGDGVPEYIGDPLLFGEKLAAQNPDDRKIYSIYDDPRSLDHDLFRTMDEFKRGVEASPTGSDESLMCLPSSPRLPKDDDDDKDASEEKYADYIKDFVRGVSGKKTENKRWETDGHPWLGDIFHASPVVVSPPSSLAPDYKYEAYFLNNRTRQTMVYAGANDGMMHAFVGEDLDDSNNDGTELWAFVPTKLLSTIQQTRGLHRTYVDATPVVRDVYFNVIPIDEEDTDETFDKGVYRTVLIGGLRGGGNSYYALDVTKPDDPKFLWEYRPGVSVAEDGPDNPVYPYDDPAVQCKQDIAESWAKPIVGQIWVKRADDDTYQARSVAMIPGGFMPGAAFGNVSSCIELIEMTVFPSTLHIVDIETGKLLKRYSFTDDGAYDDLLDELEDYYELMAAGNDNPWNHNNGQCAAFHTEDYDPDSNEGWGCAEMRANLQNPPSVPLELLADNLCWECPGDPDCGDLPADIKYAKVCCANKKIEDVPSEDCKTCLSDKDCSEGDDFRCHTGSGECRIAEHDKECRTCVVDGDCPASHPTCDSGFCENGSNKKDCWWVWTTYCTRPCGNDGDEACGSCNNDICEDAASCTEECEYEMVEQVAASRCDSFDMNHLKNGSCSYYTMEFENGSVDKWLKTEGCFLVENEDQGRLCFHVGGNFNVNGVAAHPAAYNTTFGEFITRSFMPTTGGVIWRLDMGNGLYDDTAEEGMMIEGYTDNAVDYGWGTSKFFDVTDIDDPETKPIKIAKRPIMAPPALGLTYNRSLVMFFGTGRTDDLESYDARDYFFAVEETLDAEGKPTGVGELFHRGGAAAGTAMKLDEGERLYGKPLVAAGKVIITTFLADPDKCQDGSSRMHIFDYDNVPADTSNALHTFDMASVGTPSAPSMVWTPTGPVVLAQVGAAVEVLPVADNIKPTAHALHWGQVL